MKREGYQHGMVRCHNILPDPLNPRPETRYLNRFDSPPTAGLFTRVLKKPTNHSKFTGKCGRPKCRACHESPAYKSKDKTKGTQKLKFRPGLNMVGFSGTGFLAQMDGEDEYCVDEVYEKSCEVASLTNDIKNGDKFSDCVDEVYDKSCEVASLANDIKNGNEFSDCVDEVHDKSCEVASLTNDIKSGDEFSDCVDEVHDKSCEVASLANDIKSGDENENDKICDLVFDDEDEGWYFVEETL